jgi:hypothetical protein
MMARQTGLGAPAISMGGAAQQYNKTKECPRFEQHDAAVRPTAFQPVEANGSEQDQLNYYSNLRKWNKAEV